MARHYNIEDSHPLSEEWSEQAQRYVVLTTHVALNDNVNYCPDSAVFTVFSPEGEKLWQGGHDLNEDEDAELLQSQPPNAVKSKRLLRVCLSLLPDYVLTYLTRSVTQAPLCGLLSNEVQTRRLRRELGQKQKQTWAPKN